MPLSPGDRLGPYEILAPLGAGGMGEVYRAHDPRLGRDVAIKVLHADKLSDPSRRERFLQEARSASALNHPGIVTIHDIGTEGDRVYMVMELIDGKPLDKLIPLMGFRNSELLRIGIQIADAFTKAHGAGIVHRDLKPANVMLTADGRVKVLDFGLAKLIEQSEAPTDATRTLAAHTAEGTVMGTAAYMSPEQAEAKPVDARSDIFSFGALLYEMCTGQRAFRGDTHMSVIASVIREEPLPVTSIRTDLPTDIARLIQRCLRKDPARRAQSMADLKVALEELKEESDSGKLLSGSMPAAVPSASLAPKTSWPMIAAGAIVVLSVAAYFAWRSTSGSTGTEAPAQTSQLTTFQGDENMPSFSPDGNQVAFTWLGESQDNPDIYVKLIGPGTPLRITTDPRRDYDPAWSPDGRTIAFLRALGGGRAAVILVPPLGGQERKLIELSTRVMIGGPLASLTWTPDSRQLVVSGSQESGGSNRLLLVSAETGAVKVLAQMNDEGEGFHQPDFSSDGRQLAAIGEAGSRKIYIWPVNENLELGEPRILEDAGQRVGSVQWIADSGDLLFSVGISAPVPLYRISSAGGEPRPLSYTAMGATNAAVARTGNRMIFVHAIRDSNLWQVDLENPRSAPRSIAVSTYRDVAPYYSPDGKRLAYYSNRGGSVQIWTAEADGSRATQLTSMDVQSTTGTPRWSPDGSRLCFDSDASGPYQIYVVGADGGQPRALTKGPTGNFICSWSPDGRWIYFTSARSGTNSVWRAPAEGGEPQQVVKDGQSSYAAGEWLYFTKRDGAEGLWRMPIEGGPETRLTETVYRYNYAVSGDGIYYIPRTNSDGSSTIRYLNLATKAEKEIAKVSQVDLGLALSPDGRYLLFSQRDYAGTDLILVENFK